jgi:hypothetical protein
MLDDILAFIKSYAGVIALAGFGAMAIALCLAGAKRRQVLWEIGVEKILHGLTTIRRWFVRSEPLEARSPWWPVEALLWSFVIFVLVLVPSLAAPRTALTGRTSSLDRFGGWILLALMVAGLYSCTLGSERRFRGVKPMRLALLSLMCVYLIGLFGLVVFIASQFRGVR